MRGPPRRSPLGGRPELAHRGDAHACEGQHRDRRTGYGRHTVAAAPPGPPFLGPICWPLPADRLGFVCRLKREYGDVVAFRLGPERAVLLSHPAHLHEVLVRQHRAFQKGRRGEVNHTVARRRLAHQRRRAASPPAPSPATSLASPTPRALCHGDDDACRAAAGRPGRDGDTLDVTPAMMRVTLAIAAYTLLHADVEASAERHRPGPSPRSCKAPSRVRRSPWLPFVRPPAPAEPARACSAPRRIWIPSSLGSLTSAGPQAGRPTMSLRCWSSAQTEDGRPLSPRGQSPRRSPDPPAGGGTKPPRWRSAGPGRCWRTTPTWTRRCRQNSRPCLGGRLPTVEDLPQLQYTRMVFTAKRSASIPRRG